MGASDKMWPKRVPSRRTVRACEVLNFLMERTFPIVRPCFTQPVDFKVQGTSLSSAPMSSTIDVCTRRKDGSPAIRSVPITQILNGGRPSTPTDAPHHPTTETRRDFSHFLTLRANRRLCGRFNLMGFRFTLQQTFPTPPRCHLRPRLIFRLAASTSIAD